MTNLALQDPEAPTFDGMRTTMVAAAADSQRPHGQALARFALMEVVHADEASFPQDIKKPSWEPVKTSFAETQVIIMANSHQLPGGRTLSDANIVRFTGNDQGRPGFVPLAAGVA